MQKRWFITGASRGLGVDIARAALEAGDCVVATGRDPEQVRAALGARHERLLVVRLDVAVEAEAHTAVEAAVAGFGGIDVLVNNAGYGHLGLFEEATSEDVRDQFDSNVFGLMHVTRAALPAMRAARRGHIFNVSSVAGVRGTAFCSLYCASKFAVEGFSESLAEEVAPFGIRVTIVEPGPFRTNFLSGSSLRLASAPLPDYDEMRDRMQATYAARNGKQGGDPQKLAHAIVELANANDPPLRFLAGTVALDAGLRKLERMREEFIAWGGPSRATDGDYADSHPWQSSISAAPARP